MSIWVAMVGMLLLALSLAVKVPEEIRTRAEMTADVTSVNFDAYRTSVINYMRDNPGASGTTPDGSLTWLPGYIRDARWTHVIQGGTLFTYSTGAVGDDVLQSLYAKHQKSFMVGAKGAGGTLVSARGIDTGIVLPAAIPIGAIVIVGS